MFKNLFPQNKNRETSCSRNEMEMILGRGIWTFNNARGHYFSKSYKNYNRFPLKNLHNTTLRMEGVSNG